MSSIHADIIVEKEEIGLGTNQRYFGLHFDFHASNEHPIGDRTEQRDILWYLDEAKPDFIQCDCKGHPGCSSYPTKIGHAAAQLHRDNLRIWRDATNQRGLPLFVHYSGIMDEEYIKAHPECAQVNARGEVDRRISPFSPYVTEYLIPQLKELIDEYAIDGAWVDGDCWAIWPDDCSEYTMRHIRKGMTDEERQTVMREGFLSYVKTYVDAVHEYCPSFRITSNWLYSSYVPEIPKIGVDFLSGDYPSFNSVNSARFEGRCIAAQRMPWDLMAWSFIVSNGQDKTAVQLKQEAAQVLALGGGFQIYITQNKDGSARVSGNHVFRDVGEFVRERKTVNFQKRPVAQVGVFYSAKSRYLHSEAFNPAGSIDAITGVVECVLDAQYSAGIVLEYQTDELGQYDIVVVPQWEDMPDSSKQALLGYAQAGGRLMVIGAHAWGQFAGLAGISAGEILTNQQWYFLSDDNIFGGFQGALLSLQSGRGENLYCNKDMRDEAKERAYSTFSYGKGKLCFVPFDLGSHYHTAVSFAMTDLLRRALQSLCPPTVELNRKKIDVALQQDGQALIVNLLNMRGEHANPNALAYDEIPEAVDVQVVVRGHFHHVRMPFRDAFDYQIAEDSVTLHLTSLSIHDAIVLE